jgi:opacity protein-like surface antigen
MKNIKNLLAATIALVSVSSTASLFQPHIATTELAPIRVTAGLQAGMLRDTSADKKFGLNSAGLGIGFTHNVGYDFEYGLAVGGGWAGPEQSGARLFTDSKEKIFGARLEAELLARFMPEIADGFRLGGYVTIGYNTQFGGDDLKTEAEKVAFGDMGVRAGIATSYAFTDMFSLYFAPAFALTHIRFPASDKVSTEDQKKKFKAGANWAGVDLPLGFWFGVGDNVGVYLEANTRFRNFQGDALMDSWKEDVTLGVSFAM